MYMDVKAEGKIRDCHKHNLMGKAQDPPLKIIGFHMENTAFLKLLEGGQITAGFGETFGG